MGYQCLDCPTCPPGSQPSVPCGSTIENWTAVHCVPCPLGKAFSDNYDKAQCAACSVCSTGKAVLKNCTRISNSKCSKCRKGYYYESFSFACKPCAECCGDGNDEFVKECERYDHKCQVRPTPCSHTQTTPLGTTTPTGIVPTTQETHLTVMYNKKTTGHRKEKDLPFNELKSSLKPTQVDYKAPDKEGEFENAVGTEISSVIILFAVVAVLCIVVLVLIILRKLIRLRLSLRHPREVDSSDVDNYSSHGRTRSVSNQSQSSDFASPLLHPVALSHHNSSTPHQQNGLAPNALMESGISLSREPASPFQVGSESSLPNHPEPHRPLQSEPSQSEATEVSGSTSPLHILTDSSEKTGLSPLVGLSKEAPTPNPSNSSEPNQGASSLTSACRSTHFREPESSHPGHCDSPQADLHSVSSYPTRSPSQGSRSASSQPSDSCSPIQAEYTCTSTTGELIRSRTVVFCYAFLLVLILRKVNLEAYADIYNDAVPPVSSPENLKQRSNFQSHTPLLDSSKYETFIK